LLSIGVSYFSIQAISYLADVYLEIQEPESHIGYHALALVFFPKLLQGPIERAADLLPQLKKPYQFDYNAIRSGILLFVWGLFKKVVIADRLAHYADQVFNHVDSYTGLPLIIGTYAYAFQLYFDFSGYTHMARGTARLFGIELTENFNSPYLATSIADFWRRWHISFSRWILDYIFKPLQMSWRGWGKAGSALALLITFLISGLWHGLNYGYVVWGLLHGSYLATSIFYRPYQKRLHRWLGLSKSRWLRPWQVFVTFNMTSFAWIFFRCGACDGSHVVSRLFNFGDNYAYMVSHGMRSFVDKIVFIGINKYEIMYILIFTVFATVVATYKAEIDIFRLPLWLRWSAYNVVFILILIFWQSNADFIYLKF
jgi:alginate O-acetyltransferase complex protein AlgI